MARYATFNGLIRSIFLLADRVAFQRSSARWALSQNSAELPNNRERRRAIPGLTARRSRSNSLIVWRETPSASARADAVSPKSGRKSSRSISPGWVGRTCLCPVFTMLMSHLVSVVVCQFHVVSIAVDEPKADAPLIANRNRMLSLPLPCKLMKPVAGRNLQVAQVRREVKIFELARRPLRDLGRKPSRLASCIQLLRMAVGERLDHSSTLICHAMRVKLRGIPRRRVLPDKTNKVARNGSLSRGGSGCREGTAAYWHQAAEPIG